MADIPTDAELFELVTESLAETTGFEVEEVLPDIPIEGAKNEKGTLEADSLDAVEMVMELEDSFGIKISDEDAKRLKTPRLIVNYLKRKLEDPKYTIPEDDPDFPKGDEKLPPLPGYESNDDEAAMAAAETPTLEAPASEESAAADKAEPATAD